jgi:hypothetical protein
MEIIITVQIQTNLIMMEQHAFHVGILILIL